MNIDTAPLAFPQGTFGGMTLRDYFAAHAPTELLGVERNGVDEQAVQKGIAVWAYDWADAMLAEKAKREAQ